MSSTAHLAGAPIVIQDQLKRQLCQWCGERLVDYDYSRMAVAGDHWTEPAHFPVGEWVEVEGQFPMSYHVLGELDKYPENSCLARSFAEARPLREVTGDD